MVSIGWSQLGRASVILRGLGLDRYLRSMVQNGTTALASTTVILIQPS